MIGRSNRAAIGSAHQILNATFKSNPPNAIRVCLGGPQDRGDCRDALQRIADTLDHPHHLHMPVM